MTIGENIRRIRKSEGLTQKELAERLGVTEANVRAYESGRRNPRPKTLEAMANALEVSPGALMDSDFDGVSAMHRLFQIFRAYSGELQEITEENGDTSISLTFNSLALMRSWFNRYNEYTEQLKLAESFEDSKLKKAAIQEIEDSFNEWMDKYPESEPDYSLLELQKTFDTHMDNLGLHPKNEE
jgi:transcriptional regulator with XRE-family HTH domain